jgi:glycosyltransferase involved in cell wall biosynthesis
MTLVAEEARGEIRSRGIVSGAWLHVCNGLDPERDGGMVPSILGMTGALGARRGAPVAIVTPTPSRLDALSIPRGVTLRGPETDLRRAVSQAEVLHLHGLWQGHTRRGASIARRYRVPYLIAAHGMADPWALRQKAWKKRAYLALVEGKNLRHAACLHALSPREVGQLRSLAPRTPIALVPNGVALEPLANLPPRGVLEERHPELRGKFVILFLARVHQKKGLDWLIEAVARLGRGYPHVHLLVAGTDDGALGPARAQVEALGLRERFTYLGHVSGERARMAWGAADAFALPSRSEGFSMAVLEALGCRLPVLITTACYFDRLERVGGGIVVEPSLAGVEGGLRRMLEMAPPQRAAMAQAGRVLVEREFTWQRQGERLEQVYLWLRNGGPLPEAVNAAYEAGVK